MYLLSENIIELEWNETNGKLVEKLMFPFLFHSAFWIT